MDDRRFDRLARALGGASTRRGALAALAGVAAGLGLAGEDAEAKKKRRKKCDPACPAGQRCVKGACACDNGGTVCGASCCAIGQRCEGGQCVEMPEPVQCIPAGEPCKDTGRVCCDGTVCASGQGGESDIACHVPAGGSCQSTAECAFDTTCTAGVCVAPAPPPCVPTTCEAAGATCGAVSDGCGATLECGTCPGNAICQAGACVVPCVPTIAVTADAAANGGALQNAVYNAQGPTTIVLAAGDYQFTVPQTSGTTFYGLLNGSGFPIVIETCGADDVVNLICPSGLVGPNSTPVNGCIRSQGFATFAGAFSLKGVRVQSSVPGPGVSIADGTLTLEDVTISVSDAGSAAVFAFSDAIPTTATLVSGVTLRTSATPTASALTTGTSNTVIACNAKPTYDGYASTRCNKTAGGYISENNCGC